MISSCLVVRPEGLRPRLFVVGKAVMKYDIAGFDIYKTI
jgi:hypothetical protein